MKISEAIEKGIPRIRQDDWEENTYMKLDITKPGTAGPWIFLFDRGVQEVTDLPTPQTVLRFSSHLNPEADFEVFKGVRDRDDKE